MRPVMSTGSSKATVLLILVSLATVLFLFANLESANAALIDNQASLPNDPDYRADVKSWLLKQLYPNKKEGAIFHDILKRDMHYLYIGFLEAFPSSKNRAQIEELLKRFSVFETAQSVTLSSQELETQFHFDGVNKVFRWGNAFAGMEVIAPGENRWTGPICLGNIQFLSGGFVTKDEGIQLLPKTRFIYPTQTTKRTSSTNTK